MLNRHELFRRLLPRPSLRFWSCLTLMLVLQGCAMVGVELVDSAELAELKTASTPEPEAVDEAELDDALSRMIADAESSSPRLERGCWFGTAMSKACGSEFELSWRIGWQQGPWWSEVDAIFKRGWGSSMSLGCTESSMRTYSRSSVDDSQWTWRVAWLLCLVLLWLTWSGGMDAPFVYDDRVEVFPLQDRTFSQLHSWADYNPSRPLVVLSYLFDFHLADGALDVRTFHLSSWWMHVFAVGAGLFMAESLGRLSSRPAAGRLGAIAVLLWGVHPMVSETVLYISARSELLCGGFSFLALGAWATALRIEQDEVDGLERSWPWRTAAVLACVGAIASKETGMMVPIGLAAIELGLGGR